MVLEGVTYPTAEHAFQAAKFEGTAHEAFITKLATPGEAAREGRSRLRPLRTDWELVKWGTMLRIIKAKVLQHPEIHALLLATYPRMIAEHTTKDRVWGDGGDGSGQNLLGKCWMHVRLDIVTDLHLNAPGPDRGRRWSAADHWQDAACDILSCGCCRALANNDGANYLLNRCNVCAIRKVAHFHLDVAGKGGSAPNPHEGGGGAQGKCDDDQGRGDGPTARRRANRPAATDWMSGEGKAGGPNDAESKGAEDAKDAVFTKDMPGWFDRVVPQDMDVHRGHSLPVGARDDGFQRRAGDDATYDPGRPRKGPAWGEIPKDQQVLIFDVQRRNAATITCEHRADVGGRFGGRMIVPPATRAGLEGLTCCSYTQCMSAATRRMVAPPGSVPPTQTLDLHAIRRQVELVTAGGGPVWHDPGLWDMLELGVNMGFTGARRMIVVFPVNPKTRQEPGYSLVDKATAKDLVGLPDPQGNLVANIVDLGATADAAVAELRRMFPQLLEEDAWLLCFAVGVVPESIGRKARIVDDQSKGDEPLSLNNNTFAYATPRLQLGGSEHFQNELRDMIENAKGRKIYVCLADFKSWFRQIKLAGRDAPLNVYQCPITGHFMLRLGCGFGAKTLPACTSRLTVAIAFLLIYKDGLRAHLYIDDCALLAYEDDPLVSMWDAMRATFASCNIHISVDKLVYWSEYVDFLGISYDIPARIIRVTPSRRERMLLIYQTILDTKPGGRVKSKILSSAFHSTLSVDRIVDGSRAFLQELGRLLRVAVRMENNPNIIDFAGVRVTALLRLEIEWWQTLLTENNGDALVGALCKREAVPSNFPITVATDASTHGVGGVYECPITNNITYFEHTFDDVELASLGDVCRSRVGEDEDADKITIAALELWTVVAAADMFHPELAGVPGRGPRIHTWLQDNDNVVNWVNTEWSKAPNPFVAMLLRHLTYIERQYNFRIVCHWVASADNIAPDALSRQNLTLFKSLTSGSTCTSRQVPSKFRKMLQLPSRTFSKWAATATPKQLAAAVNDAGPYSSFLRV